MEQEIQRLFLRDMSQQAMYKLFGLKKILGSDMLENWLTDLPELSKNEQIIAAHYQERLLENIEAWNEHELSMNFIGPIFASIDFTIPYKMNLFSQRQISTQIGYYELIGKPDGIIASGYLEPEIPYFCFQEYKKELDSSGDPIGQNLAAMLIGQHENGGKLPLYGCYVVGRHWHFMLLKGQDYAISRAYSADDKDVFEIVRILKKLRNILQEQL